jgi:hypothetical protein
MIKRLGLFVVRNPCNFYPPAIPILMFAYEVAQHKVSLLLSTLKNALEPNVSVTKASPMRIWRTDKRIWRGRPPKRHWPCWILIRHRHRHGPTRRLDAISFVTARKTISRSSVRPIDTGAISVTNRRVKRPNLLGS